MVFVCLFVFTDLRKEYSYEVLETIWMHPKQMAKEAVDL